MLSFEYRQTLDILFEDRICLDTFQKKYKNKVDHVSQLVTIPNTLSHEEVSYLISLHQLFGFGVWELNNKIISFYEGDLLIARFISSVYSSGMSLKSATMIGEMLRFDRIEKFISHQDATNETLEKLQEQVKVLGSSSPLLTYLRNKDNEKSKIGLRINKGLQDKLDKLEYSCKHSKFEKLAYITYLILVEKRSLYLIHNQSLHITGVIKEDQLETYFQNGFIVLPLKPIFEKRYGKNIGETKESSNLDNVMRKIKEYLETFPKVEFRLFTSKNQISQIELTVTEANPNHISSTKAKFPVSRPEERLIPRGNKSVKIFKGKVSLEE